MSYVMVLPSIYQPYTDSCLLSCELDNVFVVDNTDGNNVGVPRSWNMGIEEMRNQNADWLIICSAAIRFGPEGGLDFARWLEVYTDREDAPFVEAANVGWHLIGVSRWIIDKIGTFDENFFPAYFEDNDFAYRSFLHRGTFGWPRVDVDVSLMGTAHGIKLGGVARKMQNQATYYQQKWGGMPSHESFKHPFNNHKLGLDYWI